MLRSVKGVRVAPVTAENLADFQRLFAARGSPHYCWCTPYRAAGNEHLSSAQRRAVMTKLVRADTPIGVLAYHGEEPIGWCSVAPRDSYVKLKRSRTMPRVEAESWVVLCFFVRREARGQGVALALLRGGVRYAAKCGAEIVEGYPHDTASISATHRGHSRVFRAAGFQQDDKRWFKRVRRPARSKRRSADTTVEPTDRPSAR